MSEEQRSEETEVEAHGQIQARDSARTTSRTDDEVEAHGPHPGQGLSANDETDDEVEAHLKFSRPRHS